MSRQRKIAMKICRRAAYFTIDNSSKYNRILSDRGGEDPQKDLARLRHHSSYITIERQLIARCYQIS